MPPEPSRESSPNLPPDPPPENPQLLLAELEAARLALRSRPQPSRGRRVAVGLLVLLILGALALWCLSMMENTVKKPQPKAGSTKNSFATSLACT